MAWLHADRPENARMPQLPCAIVRPPLSHGLGCTEIRNGGHLWQQFLDATNLRRARAVALYDMHHCLDTFSKKEAEWLSIEIDHMQRIGNVVCSKSGKGSEHRRRAFDQTKNMWPIVEVCDGVIFTDFAVGRHRCVDVYREYWMNERTIAVRGDKGQAAELLGSKNISGVKKSGVGQESQYLLSLNNGNRWDCTSKPRAGKHHHRRAMIIIGFQKTKN